MQKKYFFKEDLVARKKIVKLAHSLSIFLLCFLCPYQSFSDNSGAVGYNYTPWASFSTNLKECSLGQFSLPDPQAITLLQLRLQSVSNLGPAAEAKILSDIQNAMVTVEIYGWINDRCHIVYRSARQIQNADNLNMGPLGFECNFTKDEIVVLAGIAKKLAANEIPLTGEDPTAKIKGKACKTLVDQVPPSPYTNVPAPLYFVK